MEKFVRPNRNILISGRGDWVFANGLVCTSLKNYTVDKNVYEPVYEDTRMYFPDLEGDYVKYARY
jgi:hypothetical protein